MWRTIPRARGRCVGPFGAYEDRPLIFVFGAMRDKAISEMAKILFPLADRVIATRPTIRGRPCPRRFRKQAREPGLSSSW